MSLLDPHTGLKECSRCHNLRSREDYTKLTEASDRLQKVCKVCVRQYRHDNAARHREYSQQHYADHILESKEYHAQYRQERPEFVAKVNHSRRARKVNAPNDGTVTQKALRALLDGWSGICPVCSQVAAPTIDHIQPLSQGGSESMSNLQLMCQSCNSRKNRIISTSEMPQFSG